MDHCSHYVLTFEPLARPVPPEVRVRMLLKHALRSLGLRCTSALPLASDETRNTKHETPRCTKAKEVTNMPTYQVVYVLDGEHERPACACPFVPCQGQVIVFGSGEQRVEARVEQVWWVEPEALFEVQLFRPSRLRCAADEAARWRAAGFDVPDHAEAPPPWKEVR